LDLGVASTFLVEHTSQASNTLGSVNRYELLHATNDFSLSRFDHTPHEVHLDPEEEVGDRWSIAFVVRGSFDVAVGGERVQLGEGGVLLMRPGLRFRCHHAEHCPTDVCLSIGLDAAVVADVEGAWHRPGWSARPSATPRLAYIQRRVRDVSAHDDRFQIERWALAALTALEADLGDATTRGRYAARQADVDAAAAVSRSIESSPELRRSIAERARDVDLNGAQLTRVFHRYVGVSPHVYVMRCRLARAAELLDAGRSVSEACYGSGFENLSHFCRTFQRAFCIRASVWRTLGLRERRHRVRQLTTRLR